MSGRFWSTVLLVAAACLLVSGPVSAQAGQGVGDTERRSGVLGETASDRPLDRVPGELFEGDPAGPGVGEFWKPDRLGADFWGIFPLGPGVPPEACCLPDGACINLNPVVCVLIGGKRGGPGSSCATEKCVVFGACCFPDLTCEPLATEAACLASGGKWLAGEGCGPGLACKITGACCLPDGQCDSRVTLFDCIDRGGEWHVYQGFEPDVVIDPCSTVTCFGACWIPPDGSGAVGECLLNRTAEQCEADGGFFQGYGSTGCAADPVCGREVQVVNFRRTHTDQLPPILVPFRKFDDMGGTRRLKFASLAIDAEVVHRIVLVNVSGQIGSPTFIPAIITLRTDVTRGPLPEFGLPLPEELLNFFDDNVGCPGVLTLEFAESCDFGGHIRSIVPSYFHSITDNLGGLVGAGETLDVSVEGTTLAISQFTFANVVNPINELEGVLTVIYEFEMLGACCFECPEWQPCKVLFEDECIAEGGIWQGPMTTCSPDLCEPPLGACCFECPDWQPCSELTEAACLAAGGTWQGPCTTCTPDPCDPPPGACCIPCPDWQPCQILTQAECLAAGGTWQGACTDCTPDPCELPTGACCFECPDWQPCMVVTEAACVAAGGSWQGPCTVCDPCPPPPGACCIPCPDWQPCQILTQAECLAAGGIWQGACTDCTPDPCEPPTGACCFECPDWQPCVVVTQQVCIDMGGSWQGECTVCDPCPPPPGACCIPSGLMIICEELTEEECFAQGGEFWAGPCTTCDTTDCPGCTRGCTHKGSVVVYSKIEIRWNADGQLIQDTFISLSNDHQDDVLVQFFFINGDPPLEATADEREHPGWNFLDNKILLTGNQPTWWSAATGAGYGVSPFTVLDPGTPPGRPAMDGTTDRVLRGWIVGWAVNHLGEEIRWNHLSGTGTLVYYDRDGAAWEYIACAITSTTQGIPHGGKLPNPGTLVFDGTEYCDLPSHLLLNFQAVHSTAWSTPQVQVTSDTDLTLHPLDADLRLNSVTEGVPVTWAKFDVWNEMEVKFSGMGRCISCWDQTLLRFYGSPNHTLLTTLQTDHGKARIEGIQHPNCPTSVPRALLGVHARWLTFSASGGEDRIAAAGGNLIGMGSQGAVIRHDAFGDYPPEAPIILEEVPGPFDQADRLIDQLLQQSSRRSSGR